MSVQPGLRNTCELQALLLLALCVSSVRGNYELNRNTLKASLSGLQQHLSQSARPTFQTYSGKPKRGIVISAGGNDRLANCYVGLRVLREVLGCTLPVEVAFYGKEEQNATLQALIEEAIPNVHFVDLALKPPPKFHKNVTLTGFNLKIYAIFLSSFEEVLSLDSDNLLLQNPEALFDNDMYREHGTMFWADISHRQGAHDEAYEMFDEVPPWKNDPSFRLTEAGQLLINRRQHWRSLEHLYMLACHQQIMSQYLYGDKDLFRLAFAISKSLDAFYQVPHGPRVGLMRVEDSAQLVHGSNTLWILVAQLHSSPGGDLYFLHRTTPGAKYYAESDVHATISHISVHPVVSIQYPPHWGGTAGMHNGLAFWADRNIEPVNAEGPCTPQQLAGCQKHIDYQPPTAADWNAAQLTQAESRFPVLPASFWPAEGRSLNASYVMFRELRSNLSSMLES